MNFHDLDNFNLADAVKFHQRLNPRLWGSDEHLLPDVRDKLLAIASNFQEFLGVDDLNIQDITISGSNAAYSYTRHSDIDLHLVVDMPDDPVYQELFNAKKYQYNAEHDIKIAGVPVELYVQPSDQKHVSQGIYSVKNGDWVQVPQRRRASIDDSCVQHKTADLDARIHSAIKSGNADAVNQLWDKIKTMRQTGLEKNGEFGCENIAFKLLRNMGCIGKLKDAKTAIQDRELSLNRKPAARKKVNYGMRDYWYPGTAYAGQDHPAGTESEQVDESVELDHLKKILHRFYASCVDKLKLENPPRLRLETTPEWSQENGSFGQYEPESNTLILATAGRHVLDILRTMAHEMTHRQQDERNPLPIDAGETGSPWEDQANAMAGRIMRQWAEEQPEMFDGVTLEEASGYIPTKAQARDPRFVMALTRDVRPGAVGKEANKLGLKTDSQGHPALLTAGLNKMLREFKEKDLFEIKMTSTNLRQLAAQTGAQAGMEFEMIVPDVGVDEQEPDWVLDYDQDQRTRSFSDIRDFFHDGDYNGRRAVDDLMEEIQNEYEEWQQEQTAEAWTRDGVDYMRDFVNVNDLFDRDEAMLQARDEIMDANPDLPQESEDFSQLLSARLDELQEQFVLEAFEDQGRVFNDAFEAFAEEQRDEYDEGSFLDDKYQTMSDIESNFDIEWPYYTDANEGNDGDMDIDQVADEFSSYMGKPVNASRNYHGGRREAGTYVVEPDGSLEGDNPGDEGLEFVSPPMPIDEMISDLNKVKAWADKTGCYTNDSTGLHINISVPNYSLDKLDYVKLALLMGDEYVLELFGRSGNNYAKSAIGKIKTMLKRNPDIAPQVMDKMREHMEDIATKAIHTGTTEKYTSINTKTGYIEFRSPGGDWLDSNFSKIEDTLLRFTVALDAAMDPEKYRQEYLKKLYKLLNPNGTKDEYGDMIQEFAKYMVSLQGNSKEVGDKLSKETQQAIKDFRKATFQELEQQNLARNLAKGKTPKGQKYWWDVSRPGYFASIEIVASSKEEAIAKAIEPGNYPDWASARNTLQAKPLRPYQDPKPSLSYSVYDARAGYNRSSITASSQEDAVQKFRQFVSGENNPHDFSLVDRAGTVVARGGDQQQPGPQSAAQPSTGNWGIWMNDMDRFARAPGQSDNNVLRRFPSREAAEQFITQGRAQNSRMITDIEVREIEPQQTEQPIWYVSPQGNPGQEIQIRASSELNAIRAAGEARPDIFGNTAGRSHLFRASTEPARSSNAFVSTDTVPREGQPRNLVPTGPGPWEIYRISDNSTVRELSNTSRPEAEQEARSALGMRGEAPELYGVRTRQGNNSDAAQGGIVDVGIPQTLTRPGQGQQTFTGNWLILNPDGQEIHRFSGVGNVQSDANRVAINWMRSNPGRMQAGVTVVPEMGVAASQQQYQYTSTPIPGVEDVELDIPMAQTQWEVYNRSSNQPVFVIQAANQTEAWRRGQEWVATAMQANPEVDASNFSVRLRSQSVSENITVLEQRLRRDLDALGNQKPTGPETPPKMPAGTIKVDVSDTQDWYQLGQDISDLDQADKSHYNQGPPHTVLAFGSEELENMYSHKLKRLGLPIHDLDEPGEEDMDESQEITKLGKLDNVLKKCINMIHRGHETDPEKYGRVAACLIDNKNNHTYAINLPGLNGTRRHAERVAIDQHLKRHGRIGPNAIMVTTLSPCVHDMDERYGESCTDLLADFGIEKCYAGWQDPTQHPTTDYPFNLQVTDDTDIFNSCRDIAASFLPGAMVEAFDQPYKTKSEKSEYGNVDMLAKLPDGTNLSIMFNHEGNDEWQVEFYRNNSQEVTGKGDAQRIFATVLNAIQKFITKHKPAHLTFAASKEIDPTVYYEPGEPQPNPASRAKLYDRLVQRYAKAWGYRAFRADNGRIVMYELSRMSQGQQGVAEGYSNTTFNVDRRKLNVPALIQKGAILVTHPHGEQGWETDNKEDWAFSLLSLYNVLQGGWASEAKKYLKPESYKRAEQQINSSAPNLGSDKLVYDGKYNQIMWSIKKLGIPDKIAFLDKDKQGVAEATGDSKFDTMMGNIAKPSAVKSLGREEKVHELIRKYFWHKRRADQGSAVTGEHGHDRMAQKMLMALKKMNVDLSAMDPSKLKAIKGEVYEQGVAEDDSPRIKLGGDSSAAKAWIERVYAKYPYTMQNNHVMVWGKGDDQQFAMFELVPSFSKRGAVEVKWIQAYPLRQGVGSRAMQELQAMAREDGISLTLFPWDKGQVSQSKLTKFYRGQGFTPTVKGSKSMQWEPK